MRRIVISIVLAVMVMPGWAQESVTLPLGEYKTLYRESLKQSLQAFVEQIPQQAVISIDTAVYALSIEQGVARGQVSFSGVVIGGKPSAQPLPLFSNDLAITGVRAVQGGRVAAGAQGYRFISNGSERFSLELTIAAPLVEDADARFVDFSIPLAVQNSVQITLSEGDRLLDVPGVKAATGRYDFSARTRLHLRLQHALDADAAQVIEIDTLTRIAQGDKTLAFTLYGLPRRHLYSAVPLRLPAGARYLGSSLKSSQVTQGDDGVLLLDLSEAEKTPFSIRYTLAAQDDPALYHFTLAHIENNSGREGEFVLRRAADTDLHVQGQTLLGGLPPERMPARLREWAQLDEPFYRVNVDEPLALNIDSYTPVTQPDVVLQAIQFAAVFDEGGGVMSTLTMQLPAGAGDRIQITPPEGGELWSLLVNDKPTAVFSRKDKHWVVPLDAQGPSQVVMKFVQRGNKMGLRGDLKVSMPGIALSAQAVYVTVELPARVELLSLDGDVVPRSDEGATERSNGASRRYAFEHAFYKGQALDLSVYYKEPVQVPGGDLL